MREVSTAGQKKQAHTGGRLKWPDVSLTLAT